VTLKLFLAPSIAQREREKKLLLLDLDTHDNPFIFHHVPNLTGNGAAAWASRGSGGGGGAARGGGGNAWGSDLGAGVPPVISVADADSTLNSARAALDARERDLAAREAALARAEEDVRRRAARANAGGAPEVSGRPEKNWPPCCAVLHHDIEGEVPADARGAVISAYRAYLGLVFCLIYNCAAAFARLAANKVKRLLPRFSTILLPPFVARAESPRLSLSLLEVVLYPINAARLEHARAREKEKTLKVF